MVPGTGVSQQRLEERRRQKNVVTFSYNISIWMAETASTLLVVTLYITHYITLYYILHYDTFYITLHFKFYYILHYVTFYIILHFTIHYIT